MTSLRVVLCSTLLSVAWCVDDLSFPPGFKFGAASAAYQVEGAWNVSDKGENIWDRLVHERPHNIADLGTGDVACDSYHQWKRDIEMASELGLHFYRFSLSWSRILPTGFTNKISEDGIEYYNKLINGLLEKRIEPLVTIYHWDLPQPLQDLGGWANPLIADWFAEYARVVYSLYADRVKTWITINEPVVICDLAYNTGTIAPPILSPELGTYICNKNILLAHAKAWRIYHKEYKPVYHGKVSIANQLVWFEPNTESEEDKKLAELARENMAGRYSHPIYSEEGGWPPVIAEVIAENSKRQGYRKSNLPEFTNEEIKLVKGTFDFYAINHYTSRLVRRARPGEIFNPWPLGDAPDLDAKCEKHPDWETTKSSWFHVYSPGFRRQLAWLKKQYGDIEIVVTENGYASAGGLNDAGRVAYYEEHLKQLLLAIKEDGVNVTGYTAWTLMDNFEWMDGYSSKFGLYEVDFSSPERTRTPRASAEFYKTVIQNHTLRKCARIEL